MYICPELMAHSVNTHYTARPWALYAGKEDHMDKAMQTFLEVRDRLNKPETRLEYIRCYKKPWRFYREHTAEEAVDILIKERSHNE